MSAKNYNDSKSYVTLNLPPIKAALLEPHRQYFLPKSLKRRWNQFPRQIRFILSTLVCILIVYILYITKIYWGKENPKSEFAYYKDNKQNYEEQQIDKDIVDVDDIKNTKIFYQDLPSQQKQIPALQIHNHHQQAVLTAFKHAWWSYRNYSWGYDHLNPISKRGSNWLHLGLTLVDSLDSLWLMGLKNEFAEAEQWVEEKLDFNINIDVNLFETTIRVLGGLLSAYHLTKKESFKFKAVDLADRLMASFQSPSGIPFSDVNLYTGKATKPKWGPDSSTSEVSSIQLEFRDLSKITGDEKYAYSVNNVMKLLHNLEKFDGLAPIFINANTGKFRANAVISFGARGDSYYEYLLKQWIQMGRKEDSLKNDYLTAISGMEFHLSRRSKPNNLYFIAEIQGRSTHNVINKMDELVCYLPGTLALGVHFGMPQKHMEIAEDLLYTCVQTWLKQPTNLAPEITYFNVQESSTDDFIVKTNDAHYLLRPETIESLWYLYYFTANQTYRDWGWKMFQGVEKYCKQKVGYSSISNVKNTENPNPRDKMESYFLSETLKYFYLLFSDEKLVDLNNFVLNTEGHLLPIYD